MKKLILTLAIALFSLNGFSNTISLNDCDLLSSSQTEETKYFLSSDKCTVLVTVIITITLPDGSTIISHQTYIEPCDVTQD